MVRLREILVDPKPPDKKFGENDSNFGSNFNQIMLEEKFGFRLQELYNDNDEMCNAAVSDTTSLSGNTTYKQRIDSMFDDSRSLVSESNGPMENSNYLQESDVDCKNDIQEKIDNMFKEISLSAFKKKEIIRESVSEKSDISDRQTESITNREFSVVYLGSKVLIDKRVSLISLQNPLKDLYLGQRKNRVSGFGNRLTITRDGLKITKFNNSTLNPFSTIAVWASVKFSCRRTKNDLEYAFLPLIKDPGGIDKNVLYKKFENEEKDTIDGNIENNSQPIFSVVIKNNKDKSLECHAFICTSSEEAIVIAANLYQALMKQIKSKEKSSSAYSSESNLNDSGLEITEKITAPPPKKAPAVISKNPITKESDSNILEKTTAPINGNALKRRGSEPINTFSDMFEPASALRRCASERRRNTMEQLEGDILTKVAIPRSRSFLNAIGPLSYHKRYVSDSQTNGGVLSPLGFSELFNEFRLNEGLESMDDILNAIIDAEGMSFNDLKPIYKEFILKLAVILTKDELFQRSKNIMRRQKKKRCRTKKTIVSTTALRKAFRKTASKWSKQKASRPFSMEFTSIVFQRNRKIFEESNSSTCSSEVDRKVVRRRPSVRRRIKKPEKKNTITVQSTSDSDISSKKHEIDGGFPNRTSSGYFSCSECSYDSEHCTCTKAGKCYCTLHKAETSDKMSISSCGRDTESCVDSEKCYCAGHLIMQHMKGGGICQTPHLHQDKTHSKKCKNYIPEKNSEYHSPTIFEQLKEQGFAASDSSLSRAASPYSAWRVNEEKVAKPKECLKTSKSLEFLHVRPQNTRNRQQNNDASSQMKLSGKAIHQNFVEGTRHFCYHGQDMDIKNKYISDAPQRSGRQYSSMRNPACVTDMTISRLRSRPFSSVRAQSYQESITNQVLFPDSGNSLLFPRRIDVYRSFHSRRCLERQGSYIDLLNHLKSNSPSHCNAVMSDDRRYSSTSRSRENRSVDLGVLTTKSESSEAPSSSSDRKVIVVSARDAKGKVLYMGASSRSENVENVVKERSARSASEALSVKKSAEIAALFSEVPGKQKSVRVPAAKDIKTHPRVTDSFRSSNIEHTLGYLP